jgi:short-subunit dehydrogenase
VEVVTADLADPAGADTLMRDVEGRGVTLTNLVNNAGFGLRGPFAEQPLDELMGMVALNITALTRLSRLALPGMIARGEGGILNVASTAAFQAGPTWRSTTPPRPSCSRSPRRCTRRPSRTACG